MAIRIQLRRDTAANWASSNPVLRAGEVGIETDTLKFKIGNGSSAWNSITSYANVVPGDLNNTLDGYLEVGDLSNTVAELVDGDLYIPGTDIIFEGTANSHELTLVAPDVTVDKTVTLPDATTTLVGRDTTDTLTNKTLTSPVVSGLTLSDASIIFEGSVADSYETTLTVGEPTDDRTITLPDATGTVALTNQLGISVVQTATTGGPGAETYSSISTLQFDADSGFDVTNPSSGVAKVAMNSTFKNWNVNGETGLVAQGLDTVNLISSGAITLAANNTSSPKTLTIGTTGLDEIAQDAVGNAVGNGLDYDDTTGAISVDPSEFALSAVGSPTADISLASYKITNLASPTSANDAATKAYVDNTTAGINFHSPAHAATTTNLNATYNNGTNGVGATLTNADTNAAFAVDGHTLNAGERVLVKNQTSGLQNGVYTVTTVGDLSTPWVLTRATDADNSPTGELSYGDFVFIQNGGQAGFGFIVNTTGTITIGTTAISYVQFNAGQVVVAGNGLQEATPGTLSINTAVTVDLNTAQTLTNKTLTSPTITGTGAIAGTFTGNLTGNVTGDVSGNAGTVTNGVYTTGSYSDPSWITSLAKSKVGLGNVENTAISTWAGSTNLTTLGTISTGTWNGSSIGAIYGGTAQTSYATGDILFASATNTLSKRTIGSEGQILTVSSGVPVWAAAPVTLPTQTGNSGKFLTTNGSSASWADTPIVTGTATISANTATTIDTNALSGFTSIEYMVSLKQGSKIRTSKVVVQTDGTSVDMTEFAITETGGTMSGVAVSASASGGNALLQVTVTDASSTNVSVKFSEVKL